MVTKACWIVFVVFTVIIIAYAVFAVSSKPNFSMLSPGMIVLRVVSLCFLISMSDDAIVPDAVGVDRLSDGETDRSENGIFVQSESGASAIEDIGRGGNDGVFIESDNESNVSADLAALPHDIVEDVDRARAPKRKLSFIERNKSILKYVSKNTRAYVRRQLLRRDEEAIAQQQDYEALAIAVNDTRLVSGDFVGPEDEDDTVPLQHRCLGQSECHTLRDTGHQLAAMSSVANAARYTVDGYMRTLSNQIISGIKKFRWVLVERCWDATPVEVYA